MIFLKAHSGKKKTFESQLPILVILIGKPRLKISRFWKLCITMATVQ